MSIGRLRGTWHGYHGVPLLATYHPAFLLALAGHENRGVEGFPGDPQENCN
jgi:DNA polymerase